MTQLADQTTEEPILGSCPSCGGRIPSGFSLIQYRTSGGWPQMFAECPRCRDVVHPE